MLDCVKWSQINDVPPAENLILVDSMGQIIKQARYYNMCFVGGSFVNAGGHNVWEPFLEGIKIIIGPWYYNQVYAVNHLKSRELLSVIEKPEDLLGITYEPYNIEVAAKIIQSLREDYHNAIRQIVTILKPTANNVFSRSLID